MGVGGGLGLAGGTSVSESTLTGTGDGVLDVGKDISVDINTRSQHQQSSISSYPWYTNK